MAVLHGQVLQTKCCSSRGDICLLETVALSYAKQAVNHMHMYYLSNWCMQDNGTGMPHEDIPSLLGRVLSGTKYGVKQTRGKFGLGAKMALIWSKLSTGLPIEVWSARRKQAFVSYYKLDIDIHKCVTSRLACSAPWTIELPYVRRCCVTAASFKGTASYT